jgi:hypothetical protein
LAQEPDNELTELQEIVGSHLSSYDDAWREYGVAIILNKIFCGDISLLILKELDKVNPIKKLIDSESEKIMKVIDLLPQVDSVELADGRMLPGERYAIELQEKADIVKRFIERKWPIIIGRAKAIAVSRNRRRSQETDESVKSIMNEVIANLQAVIPPERCNSPRLKNLKPIWREWMLAYESMGIFALENHNCKLAIEYLDQARQFCTDPEDDFRLQRTRVIAGLGLDLEDVLSDDEVKLIKELLPDDNSDLPRR